MIKGLEVEDLFTMCNYTKLMEIYEANVIELACNPLITVADIDKNLPAKKMGVKPLRKYIKALIENYDQHKAFLKRRIKHFDYDSSKFKLMEAYQRENEMKYTHYNWFIKRASSDTCFDLTNWSVIYEEWSNMHGLCVSIYNNKLGISIDIKDVPILSSFKEIKLTTEVINIISSFKRFDTIKPLCDILISKMENREKRMTRILDLHKYGETPKKYDINNVLKIMRNDFR